VAGSYRQKFLLLIWQEAEPTRFLIPDGSGTLQDVERLLVDARSF